jgi:haloalkane dehalogenase
LLRLGRNSRVGAYLIRRCNAFAAGATRLAVTQPLPREVARAYTAPYDTPANRLATLRFVQDIPLAPGDRGYDIVEATGRALPQFAQRPIFMAWGLRDFVFDHTCLRTFREAWPDAEVHAYADAGHYVLEDAHARIVPPLRSFLQRTG